MGFFGPSAPFFDEEFDPITGQVPSSPFRQAPDITKRARALLTGRSHAEIEYAVETVDWLIDEYFAAQKQAVIDEIFDRGDWLGKYIDAGNYDKDAISDVLDAWPKDSLSQRPDFPERENTTSLEALKGGIALYDLTDDAEFPDGTSDAYFAVFALCRIAECFRILNFDAEKPRIASSAPGLEALMRSLNSFIWRMPEARVAAARGELIDGLEAVAFAEYLSNVRRLESEVAGLRAENKRLTDFELLPETVRALQERLELQNVQHTETVDTTAHAIAKQRLSSVASKAARERHAETRAMKKQVWTWCDRYFRDFASMDAAAEAVIYKVRLVPVKLRTARDWIGQWAKQQRSARAM